MGEKVKVVVLHTTYGCESGCCGHAVEVDDHEFGFQFSHPSGDNDLQWAKEFAQEAITKKYGENHVADLDWANCQISDS